MPQQYTLNLIIDSTILPNLAGESIIIAKPVNNASGTPNVAWLSFIPMETNKVQWTEQYAIYASETQVQSGATIFVASATAYPASDGVCYEFATSNVFKGAIAAPQPVPSGSYSALNEQTNPPTMTFGLSQSALLNGSNISLSPINAQSVPSEQQVIFTPYTTIWVWMQANVTSGSVVTGVYGKPAQITFGGSTTDVTLQYSQSAGGFVAGSSAKALKGAAATADAALGGATVKLLDFSKYAR